MEDKPKQEKSKLVELFENEKFRKVFVSILGQPKSVTEIERLTGVSRMTIYKFFEQCKEYIKLGFAGFTKDKPYYFDIDILVDYLSEVLQLTPEEKQKLFNVLSEENIKNIVVKNNISFELLISKVFFVFINIKLLYGKTKGVPTFSIRDIMKNVSTLESFTPEETSKFGESIQNLTRTEDKVLESLTEKFISANVGILVKPKDWVAVLDSLGQILNWVVSGVGSPTKARKLFKELSKGVSS
jgi:hypothetical protein